MKHRLLHRMGVAIMILAVLGLLILLTARSSWVQTKVATIWLTRIEAASDAELSVGKIKVRWPFGIRIENLLVKGPLSDTLFYSPWIHVSINHLNFKKRRFRIGNVLLSDPVIRIKQLPDGRMNYYSLVKVFKSGDTVGNERFDFHCDRLTLHHGKFQYRKFGALPEPHQLNTNDLFVTDIEADIAGISRTMKGWSAKIDHMSFKEQSGLILNELTSKVEQDTMAVHISRLHLQTEFSTLILPDAQWMIFKTHLKNDSDNLHLRISRGSQIDFRDITCITGQKINLPPLYLSGNYTGSIRYGVFRNGNINLEGVVSYIGSFNYRYTGDWMNSYIDMNCRQLALDLNGLQEKALNGQIPGLVSGIPASLTELGRVGFEGTLQGTPGDFTNQGIWHTTMGELHTGLRVEKDSVTSHFLVKGTLESEALNPNLLSGWQLPFSRLAFTVQVDGIWDGHDHWIAGVTGDLQQFRYRGKDFHHLKINGLTGDQGFQGNLKLNDPDLQFEFSGGLDLSGTVPAVDVDLDIGYASLVNLGFVTHDTLAELQMKMQGEFKGNNLDDLSGQLWIENSKYTNSNGVLPVSDLSFSIRPEMGGRKFILNSEYVDARVIGAIYPGKLLQQLSQLSADYLPLETSENSLSSEKNLNNFSFNINLKNPTPVTRTLLPFVQIKDNTQISGQYNAENQKIYIEGSSPQFALGHTQYTNLFFQLESFKDSLTLIGQLDKLQFDLYSQYDRIKLNCHLTSGQMDAALNWSSADTIGNTGILAGHFIFNPDQQGEAALSCDFYPQKLLFQNHEWYLDPFSLLISRKRILVNHFNLHQQDQNIRIDGAISRNAQDTLLVHSSGLHLESLQQIVPSMQTRFTGTVNGYSKWYHLRDNTMFLADMTIDSLRMNGELIGTTRLSSTSKGAGLPVYIDLMTRRGQIKTIRVNGFYEPMNDRLNFKVDLDKLRLNILTPFVDPDLKDLKGLATGSVRITGSRKRPEMNGLLHVQKGSLVVGYTNTRYGFTHDVMIRPDRFWVTDMEVTDDQGAVGYLTGGVTHQNFRNIQLDLQAEVKDFMGLNTNEINGDGFWGTARGTGIVSIKGPLHKLKIDVSATTTANTSFSVPVLPKGTVREMDFVTYVSADSEEIDRDLVLFNANLENGYHAEVSGAEVNLELEVTPDAEVQLIFDSKVGDVIRGRGRGNVRVTVPSEGGVKMVGDYTIEEGDYRLTLQNMPVKKFVIQPGGTIKWSGDVFNAQLDIDAVYKTKAALYDLLQDDAASDLTQRLPVECHLLMTGMLKNPVINFNILLPPTSNDFARSQLESLPEEEMNKQVFALLVLNRFLPLQGYTAGQARGVEAAGLSTTTEVLSNQLNYWLSQISKDFDIGFHYRPGDQISSNEVEVALSTQLLNNRMSINMNGNYGIRSRGAETSQLVGDVEIEYKIKPSGKLRVRAFTRANDRLLYEYAPYTQGIGLFYREDFNTFGQLWRKYRIRWLKKTTSVRE